MNEFQYKFNRQRDLILKYNIRRCKIVDRLRIPDYFLTNAFIGSYKDGRVSCMIWSDNDTYYGSGWECPVPLRIELFEYDSYGNTCHYKGLKRSLKIKNDNLKYEIIDDKLFQLVNEKIERFSSTGQCVYEESYYPEYSLERKVINRKDIIITKNGNIMKQEGPYDSETISILDSQDRIREVQYYKIKSFSGKELISTRKNEYDSDGNIISSKSYDVNGTITIHTIYEYSENRKIKEIDVLKNESIEYIYSHNKYILKVKHGDGGFRCRELIYNDAGLVIEEMVYFTFLNGKYESHHGFSYQT